MTESQRLQKGRWWQCHQTEAVRSPYPNRIALCSEWGWTRHRIPRRLHTRPVPRRMHGWSPVSQRDSRSKTAAPDCCRRSPSTSSSTLILDSPLRTRGLSLSSSPSPPLSSKVGSEMFGYRRRSWCRTLIDPRCRASASPNYADISAGSSRRRTRADFRLITRRRELPCSAPCRAIRRRRSIGDVRRHSRPRTLAYKGTTSSVETCSTQHPDRTSTTVPATATVCTCLRSPGASGAAHGPASRSRGYGQPVAVASPPQTQQDDTGPAEVRRRRRGRQAVPAQQVRLLLVAPSSTLTPTTATSTFST